MSVNQVNQSTGALSPIAGGTLYADAPVGSIQAYGGATAPFGWLLCQGQAISRATYAELFGVIGTSFGAGDGSTTFNIPDLRGEFLRGAGTNSHSGEGNGGSVGTHQGATRVPTIYLSGGSALLVTPDQNSLWGNADSEYGSSTGYKGVGVTRQGDTVIPLNYSTRPTNTSVNFIIKATTIALPSDFEAAVDDKLDTKMDYHAYDSITLPSGCTRSYQQNRIKDLGDGMAIMTFSIMPINGEGYLPSGLTDLGTLPTKYTGILPASIYVPSSLGWTGCGNIYVSGGKILYLAGSSSGTVVTLNSIQRIAAGGVISY